jgi:glycosyltransferase involved in cell wall biosynthesis
MYGRKKRYVVTYHSDIVKQRILNVLYSPLKYLFLKNASLVVTSSPQYANSSRTLKRLNNVIVIPIGLDASFGDNYRSIQFEKPYFFFIGVHRYYKGLVYLVQAAVNLECDVVIAGSGPETNKLKALASELGANNVKFPGQISEEEKVGYFKGCIAFVLPSHLRSEAFGVCLLEAMAAGKALITTNIDSGMSYVNNDGVTGLSVSPCSVESLRSAMLSLLQDRVLALRMGKAARERFVRKFTASVMRNSYDSLYRDILSSN